MLKFFGFIRQSVKCMIDAFCLFVLELEFRSKEGRDAKVMRAIMQDIEDMKE